MVAMLLRGGMGNGLALLHLDCPLLSHLLLMLRLSLGLLLALLLLTLGLLHLLLTLLLHLGLLFRLALLLLGCALLCHLLLLLALGGFPLCLLLFALS